MINAVKITLMVVLIGLCLAPAVGDERAEQIRANLGTAFSGSFSWDAGGDPQKIRVTLERVRVSAEGHIVATGKGQYDSAGEIIDFNVMWQIDPQSMKFEMWEASPSSTTFVSDGSHVGAISDDLRSITARWTTRETGQQGTLSLRDASSAADTSKSLKQ